MSPERMKEIDDAMLDAVETVLHLGPVDSRLPPVSPTDFAPPEIRDEAEIKRAVDGAPDFVVPRGDVPRVGVLSSTALAKEYAKSADDIVELGKELERTVARCEEMASNARNVVEHLNKTAEFYRAEGKAVFKQIEDCAILTEDIRRQSELMRQRLREAIAE